MRDADAVQAEVICCDEHLPAEALDLQAASSLGAKALDQSVRSEHEERKDNHERYPCERGETLESTAGAASSPRPDERDRQQDDGGHLGSKREPEQREREDLRSEERRVGEEGRSRWS